MTPYLKAHEEYLKEDRGMTWTEALDWHFQVGAVVSTPEFFAMLRPVELRWSDDEHQAAMLAAPATSDTWHVWAVAGSLAAMLWMALRHDIEWVTFQRHGGEKVRRMRVKELLERCGG